MKNKKILINYADTKYRNTQRFNSWTGVHIAGFDKVYEFSPEKIDEDYKKKHSDIFNTKRGNGLWLWKPYIISKVMEECEDGDIIFYADSGSFFLKKIEIIINSFKEGEIIWVSDLPLIENCFTKPKCFSIMKCDTEAIRFTNQIQATFFMAICNRDSRDFVKQWRELCENIELISPEGGLEGGEPVGNGFVAHREDQSLLSLLCKKRGILPHKDPSQRGSVQETYFSPNYTFSPTEHDDNYKNVIFLHKSPTVTLTSILKTVVRVLISKYSMRKKMESTK